VLNKSEIYKRKRLTDDILTVAFRYSINPLGLRLKGDKINLAAGFSLEMHKMNKLRGDHISPPVHLRVSFPKLPVSMKLGTGSLN
jgi:hypothetical protein